MGELVIRREQMRILYEAPLCGWICDYLRRAYPGATARMGEARLSRLVAAAVKEARLFRLQDAVAVRKYAHVVFLLGPRPSENFAWARKILNSRDYHHPGAWLRALEDAAIRHLEKTAIAAKEK